MKRTTWLYVLAATLFCAAGARAQGETSGQSSDASSSMSQTAPKTKAERKAAWENGVKADCSAETGSGGVCEGKDFDSGLLKCLHQNRKKLSDGCRAAVHPHKRWKKGMKKGAKNETGGSESAPTTSSETAPTTNP